jgi:hypothetical protein
LKAFVENTTLSFDCSPSINDLEDQFGKVKKTIEKTNADYKNLREEVIVQFQEAQNRRAEDKKRYEDRVKATQDALDKLKL